MGADFYFLLAWWFGTLNDIWRCQISLLLEPLERRGSTGSHRGGTA